MHVFPTVSSRDQERLPVGPIIAVLIGAVASLGLSCVVIALVVRARHSQRPKKKDVDTDNDKDDALSLTNQTDHSGATYINSEEQSPDVIPYRNSK